MRLGFKGLLAASALLSACAGRPPQTAPALTAAQILAMSQCPLQIAEATAWVSFHAGQARTPSEFKVAIGFTHANATALALRSPDSTADDLILELRTTDDSTTPGRVGYHETAPKPLYKRVVLRCHGGEIGTITTIGEAR